MAYPTPIVEIAFDHGPYELSPTWTDVTPYVWSMTIDRGRSDDWGDFDGSASVTLNNRDRRFDPYYTSGPYYGKLLPRRQIRIRAQTTTLGTTTTHDVFRGFVDGWKPEWTDAGTNSSVTLSCFDALQLLGSDQLPADWSRAYILSTNPRHYWPCDEPITPFTAGGILKDYGSYPLDATTSTTASSGDQLAVGLVNSSIQGTSTPSASSAAGIVSTAIDFSACMWAVFDPETIYQPGGIIGNCIWTLEYEPATSTYLLFMLDYNGTAQQRMWRTVSTFDGGTPRHIGFTFNVTSKAVTFYVDGVAQSITTIAPTSAFPFSVNEGFTMGVGQLQQFIVWGSIQPAAVFQEIYKYSTVALAETTAARFQRIIGQSLFPAALTSPASAPVNSVLDITDDAPFIAPELRKVATSEGGPLFVSKAGVITMFNQLQQFTQTKSVTSQVTYGDGGTDMGLVVELSPDGDSMRNVVNITMSQGGVYNQENTTSSNAYGAASMSLDTQVQTLANAQALANIATGWGGNIYPRLSPIDVVLDAANNWTPTLNLELMERITVNVKPPTGNTISTPMLVQSIRHQVEPGFWQTSIEGSARWAAVWIWGQSTWGGTDLLG